jgi:uncharacterized protein involved in outer membrane biogenesis
MSKAAHGVMMNRVSSWMRRALNGAVAVAVLLALYALAGFLVLPEIAQRQLETRATQELGRTSTLRRVEFNPFTFRGRLIDFAIADRDGPGSLLRFETLDVDVSAASIRYLAPVFDTVRLVRPRIDLVRNADGSYSISDLVERWLARPPGPTPPFSLNNIEIEDGSVTLDDRPHARKLTLANLGIAVPFLSSLAHDAEIRVTPRLEGTIENTSFKLAGTSTTPFADVQEATLDLDLDRFAFAKYAEYIPLSGDVKLVDGALTTRVTLAFTTEKGTPRSITLSGTARVDQVALARRDGSPLISAQAVDIGIKEVDALSRTLTLDRFTVRAPRAELRRLADGTLELQRLFTSPSGVPEPARNDSSANTWRIALTNVAVSDGALRLIDSTVSPAFDAPLSNVAMNAKEIRLPGSVSELGITFDSNDGAHFEGRADADLEAKRVQGQFTLTRFHLDKLYPYYASALNLEVRRGTLDLAAKFAVDGSREAPQVTLQEGVASLGDIEMGLPGEREPLWQIRQANLGGIDFDLARRVIRIDRVESPEGTIRIVRQSDGSVDFERIVKTRAAGSSNADTRERNRFLATAAQTAETRGAGDHGSPAWTYSIHKLAFARLVVAFEDRAVKPPVRLRVDGKIGAEDLGNAQGSKGTIDAAVRVGATGRLRAAGMLATNPVALDVRIDAGNVDIVALRPYYEAQTNVIVTRGAVTTRGRVTFAAGRSAVQARYTGDITITDFASLDRPSSQELLRWKKLTLTGVDAGTQPQKLTLGAIALDDFYTRLIVNPDATLNLRKLISPEEGDGEAPLTTATVSRTKTAELPVSSTQDELPVAIERIQLSGGEVEFSDYFIKPNYSAHLTNVAGSVSALSARQSGNVELTARLESSAPVAIRGAVNPFSRELALDLQAKATDIDLPPLTPYSTKYAGYGIQKGKLSFEVHYAIDKRKLSATNKLVLDQLTFGERVESPTATKLPVVLAVALLKDRNGRINLDLPIQGTLDDPQFSVWRIVVQIIGNLIEKMVTAPFAVLSALVGGGGEQLAYVEFSPGRAEIDPAAEEKLQTLAKALADRPALRLDAAGRAIPDKDREGLKRVALDRALRAQKQKVLASRGESAPAPETLTIEATEYDDFLKAVYHDAKLPDKPRNFFGLDKDIPKEEMEARLLASYGADDTALRDLANRRAQAVEEWLVGRGGLAADRVFVLAPKLDGTGIKDQGAATRVDFSIK